MTNPAITAALIAATQQEEIAEKIERRLRKAGAVSRSRAAALDWSDKELELVEKAIARETVQRRPDGRLYLSEQRIGDRSEGQLFLLLLLLLAVASVLATVIVLVKALD